MRLIVTFAVAVAAVGASPTAPGPSSLSPSVSLWYQNNLDWTDDHSHNGFLFLNNPLSHTDASKTCALYGEQLVSSSVASKDKDLLPLMQYAALREELSPGQSVWLADASAQVVSGRVKITPGVQGPSRPALCTQSGRGTTHATSTFSTKLRVNATSLESGNTYVGYRDLKSFRFLGIPFADPPARFEYSSVASTRNGRIDASKFGPSCFQPSMGIEDCLSLNVFTPHVSGAVVTKSKLRPVLFYIHGGGFAYDNSSNPLLDGGNFASRGDVVVVTIQYRLSTLGFLAVPGTNITGNYGLADQITALQWVKQNIAAFGGDSDRVTISGQSAGAGSVRALLASPKARGLFHAAIAASTPGGYGYYSTYTDYYTLQQLYDIYGAAAVEAAGCTNSTEIVACLKTASADALISVNGGVAYLSVDGTYLTSSSLDLHTPGNSARVPVLIGTMADELASLWSFTTPGTNKTTSLAGILSDNPPIVPVVDASPLFPLPNTGDVTLDIFNLTVRVGTDIGFSCISQATAHTAVKNGVWPTAYYYQFDRSYLPTVFELNPNYPCQAPRTATHPNGDPSLPYFSCHSAEIQVWFGTFGQFSSPFRDQYDLPFAQHVLDSFASFVRTHDPNPDATLLLTRGYTNTSNVYARAGKWAPITKSVNTLRRLDWPPRQSGFLELEQCKLLDLPVSYYENAST